VNCAIMHGFHRPRFNKKSSAIRINSLKNYDLTPYSRNKREIKAIFILKLTDRIQNIHRELCYHARFFTAPDSTKE